MKYSAVNCLAFQVSPQYRGIQMSLINIDTFLLRVSLMLKFSKLTFWYHQWEQENYFPCIYHFTYIHYSIQTLYQ